MTNNIQVTIYTFAFGAMCGIGTLFYLAFNGANIASVLALTYRAGFGNDLVTFMVAHGVIELSCIFIAGGAGLLIGSAMLMPGDLTRADALKTRGMEAVRLMMGVALLLVVAGTIEGFISPAPIDPRIKFSIAAHHRRRAVFLPALRWVTKALTDLTDSPRSFTRKYVSNKAGASAAAVTSSAKPPTRFNQTQRRFTMMNDLFGN